jgi:hypothetical protein
VLLIPYILSNRGKSNDEYCENLIEMLFPSGDTAALASEGRTFLNNLKCALDISHSGAITALQLDRVTRFLPERATLFESLAILSRQASLRVLPVPFDEILKNSENLIGDDEIQRRLNTFLDSRTLLSGNSDEIRSLNSYYIKLFVFSILSNYL